MSRILAITLSLAIACLSLGIGWRWWRTDSRQTQDAPVATQALSGPTTGASLQGEYAEVDDFLKLLDGSRDECYESLERISRLWHPGSRIMLVEVMRFLRNPIVAQRTLDVLQTNSGKQFGRDFHAWFRDIWSEDYRPHPDYAQFKSRLYGRIDSRFAAYFEETSSAKIRLDEILWGGVKRDGIPPLDNPETTPAESANYLQDDNVVFGVKIGGTARAYPKRILAWHEMVKDVVGGEQINGVYCTLCGSMIVYRTTTGNANYDLGTSGFLYRSNKLMYDRSTESLWSTIKGEPVVGPLVDRQIRLEPLFVVTTTWGKWRQLHPETDVLTLNTGHQRDYSEGAAYRDYFASDALMFAVPTLDKRLKNKAEVFVLRSSGAPVAFDVNMLRQRSVVTYSTDDGSTVLVADDSGAVRAYWANGLEFQAGTNAVELVDGSQRRWRITEQELVESETGEKLSRIPGHNAFWFGWHAAHPDTILIK